MTIATRVQRRLAKAVGAKQALSKSFTADMQRTAILDKMDEKQLLELELEPEPVQSNANAVATIGSGELPTGCARPSPLSPPSPPSPLPALQPSRPPCHLRAVHSHLFRPGSQVCDAHFAAWQPAPGRGERC